MKRIIAFVLIFALFIGVMPAFAAQGRRGASDRALERAGDEAIFHRVGDWFATKGKTEQEKKAIIAERKAKRAAKRAQKEAEKKKKMMKKEAKRKQKELQKQMKVIKK